MCTLMETKINGQGKSMIYDISLGLLDWCQVKQLV